MSNTRHCEECGEAIPAKRLAAVPTARYCLEHQQAHDRTYTIYTGNASLVNALAVGSAVHADDLRDLTGGFGGWA